MIEEREREREREREGGSGGSGDGESFLEREGDDNRADGRRRFNTKVSSPYNRSISLLRAC